MTLHRSEVMPTHYPASTSTHSCANTSTYSWESHFPGIPGKNEKNGSFSSLGNTGTKIKAKDQKNDVYYIC